MDWNNLTFVERLEEWRSFRNKNNDTDSLTVLENTASFWASAPLGSRTLDFYTPDQWPDPWEILHNGTFCQNSVSLLIYYSLVLIDIDETLELILIDDSSDRYLAVLVDDKYILNYALGEVCKLEDYKESIRILERFDSETVKQIV